MTISAELVDMLCCPESRQPVRLADPSLVARLNAAITAGSLREQSGELVTEPMDEGLLREDGKVLYPVRAGIPVMLSGAGVLVA